MVQNYGYPYRQCNFPAQKAIMLLGEERSREKCPLKQNVILSEAKNLACHANPNERTTLAREILRFAQNDVLF